MIRYDHALAGQPISTRRTPRTWRKREETMSRRAVTGVVVALGFAVAGCGSSGAENTVFTRAVNAVCSSTNHKLGALAAPHALSGNHRNALIAKLVAEEIPIDDAEVRKLGSLRAPGGERAAYADAVAEARADIAALPRIVAALRSNDSARLNTVTQQSGALSDIAVAAMRRLKLRQCARNL
jgi:hypothetical protein